MAEESDGLNGFSESHFVGQDSIDSVFVQRRHPLITFDLKQN